MEKTVFGADKRLALITVGSGGSGRGFAPQMATVNLNVIVSDVNIYSAELVAQELALINALPG